MKAASPVAKPFLFIHIRKTAGISLRGLLANRFPADRVLFQAHSVSGPQQPGEAQFVAGHVDFDYAQHFSVWPTTFTMLREPVSRSLSAYDFFQSHDEPYFRNLAAELSETEYESRRRFSDRARTLGLLQFLIEEESLARRWLGNVQTRQLAGASCAGLADDDPRLLEFALCHLARIDLAGIVERLQETLRVLRQIMRWGRVGPLQHLNRTVLSNRDFDPRCFEILRSWNRLDLRLYEEACRRFESKLAALDSPSNDSLPDPPWPVEGEVFTPDQPIYGYGWHEREQHQGRWLCWNSAPAATLSLLLSSARPTQFCCLLSHVISDAALHNLTIALNSMPLSLRMRGAEGGVLLESAIPAQAWIAGSHLVQLTFKCPAMSRPCDIDPNSTDLRSLGIALGWLRFD